MLLIAPLQDKMIIIKYNKIMYLDGDPNTLIFLIAVSYIIY